MLQIKHCLLQEATYVTIRQLEVPSHGLSQALGIKIPHHFKGLLPLIPVKLWKCQVKNPCLNVIF